MKHVVFLVGAYYPSFSAVGYCAYQVHKCLKDHTNLTVISQRSDMTHSSEDDLDGISIRRIETRHIRRRNRLKAMLGLRARVAMIVHRTLGAARRLLARETVDQDLVRAYIKSLDSMSPRPDVIVPLVFPFETVIAAQNYRNSNPAVQVYPYLFDDFVESGSLHVLRIARWLKRGRHLQLERRMLEEADAVLSMHPLREHFEAHFEDALLNKITFLEHPLLIRPHEHDVTKVRDGIIRLCYTGSLIRKVREVDYLLELLRNVRVSQPLRADFFVMGNYAAKVKTETIGDTIQIVNHGQVPKTQADAAIRKADILLNLGEAKGKQVSSKVFEYMSTGKPIIHLAYVEDDAVSRILANYPLALCLVQDPKHLSANVHSIEEYIMENCFKELSFENLEKLFPEALPETTGKILRNLIG